MNTSDLANPLENALANKDAWVALRNAFDVKSDPMVYLFYKALGGIIACTKLLDAMQQYVSLSAVFCEEDAKLKMIGIHYLYVAMVRYFWGEKQQASKGTACPVVNLWRFKSGCVICALLPETASR